jgi:hypothetical protein
MLKLLPRQLPLGGRALGGLGPQEQVGLQPGQRLPA